MLCTYLVLLLLSVIRLVRGYTQVRRLRSRSSNANLSPSQVQIVQWCWRTFVLKELEIRTSALIEGPAVAGFRKPVLLLPDSFTAAITDDEFLAAVGHECAHIVRADPVRNLLYECLSIAIAWHPVTRLLKAQIARTREVACDQMVSEVVMSPNLYASALLRLASRIPSQLQEQNIYAVGIFDANILEKRITNLRTKRIEPGWTKKLAMSVLTIAIAGCCAGTAVGLNMQVDQSPSATFNSKFKGRVYTISVADDVRPPRLMNDVEPVYPKDANEPSGFEGASVVKGVVDKKGKLWDVKIERSLSPKFDEAAIDAVRRYQFTPGTHKGKPVATSIQVEIHFQKY